MLKWTQFIVDYSLYYDTGLLLYIIFNFHVNNNI